MVQKTANRLLLVLSSSGVLPSSICMDDQGRDRCQSSQPPTTIISIPMSAIAVAMSWTVDNEWSYYSEQTSCCTPSCCWPAAVQQREWLRVTYDALIHFWPIGIYCTNSCSVIVSGPRNLTLVTRPSLELAEEVWSGDETRESCHVRNCSWEEFRLVSVNKNFV